MDDSNDPNPSADATADAGTGLPESVLEDDDMFEALAHERRRYLLYTLLDRERWPLWELASRMAAWEAGDPEDAVDEREVERVYTSLFHAHVPKLVDLGILEFDRQDETITRGSHAERTLEALEHTGASAADAMERHARREKND